MPPEARVYWFEDDPNYLEAAQIFVEQAGHQIVGRASTYDEAEKAVPGLVEKGVQVVIVDGDLSGMGNFLMTVKYSLLL